MTKSGLAGARFVGRGYRGIPPKEQGSAAAFKYWIEFGVACRQSGGMTSDTLTALTKVTTAH